MWTRLRQLFSRRCGAYWFHCYHFEHHITQPRDASCRNGDARRVGHYLCCRCAAMTTKADLRTRFIALGDI